MTDITIESNIPVPDAVRAGRAAGTGRWASVIARMQPGDSFAVPTDAKPGTLGRALSGYVKRHAPASKFTVRKLEDGSRRCWRLQ